jgi:hypothetical protein
MLNWITDFLIEVRNCWESVLYTKNYAYKRNALSEKFYTLKGLYTAKLRTQSKCFMCTVVKVFLQPTETHWRESNQFENRFSNIITAKLWGLDESSNLRGLGREIINHWTRSLENPRWSSLWRAPLSTQTHTNKSTNSQTSATYRSLNTRVPTTLCFTQYLPLPTPTPN